MESLSEEHPKWEELPYRDHVWVAGHDHERGGEEEAGEKGKSDRLRVSFVYFGWVGRMASKDESCPVQG
jgi:hypothetical protein